jgi:hypothetical protein
MPSAPPLSFTWSLAVAGRWPGDCLADAQAIVVDGANRICAAAGVRPLAFAASALALVACALLLARGGRIARGAMPALALACALPGWWATLVVRADAPGHARGTARAVAAPLDRYRAFAERHACVDLATNACVACQPLAQLAFVACDGRRDGAGHAIFGAGAFVGACTESATELRCPASP